MTLETVSSWSQLAVTISTMEMDNAAVSVGVLASPAPAIEQGQPLDVDNVMIASKRQLEEPQTAVSKRRRVVTNDELVPEAHYVPLWAQTFQQMMTERLKMMQEHEDQFMNRWEQYNEQIQQRLRKMRLSLGEIRKSQRTREQGSQRFVNRGIKDKNEKLEPVMRVEDGRVPENFPATVEELMNSDKVTVDEWLLFYGLRCNGSLSNKKRNLKQFFGASI